MIFAAVLAGGIGSRMNMADMPKQFLQLGDKPLIIHTVEKFLLNPRFNMVYAGIHPDWVTYMQDIVEKYIPDELSRKLVIVPGGKDRNLTIMNVIDEIQNEYGENEEDVIVTHDAVRVFVTQRIINDNIDAVLEHGACDTAIMATDTIVHTLDGKVISDIPNRAELYQGQTPQSFNMKELKDLFFSLNEEQKKILTDACKIFVVSGKPVHLVDGDVGNFKITTVTDYKIAKALIGGI